MSERLYLFLTEKAWQLTEDWYASLEKNDPEGVYASQDQQIIKELKKQNHDFHLLISKVFIEDQDTFYENIKPWIDEIVNDTQHQNTPTHFVLREFMRVRQQYFELIETFVQENAATPTELALWRGMIVKAIDHIILRFSDIMYVRANDKLKAQQQVIHELSSPIIQIDNETALLPLIGDIDTARAQHILENILQQCAASKVTRLFIDLSGVVLIDTMVAHELFKLIDALTLLGVKAILSGMRPEIAQTAINLGISFDQINICSTLANALIDKRS